MTLLELFQEYAVQGGVILLVILTLVEITPIKINPWSALLKWMGKALFSEQMAKLDSISQRVDALEEKLVKLDEKIDVNEAKNARIRILCFSDDLMMGRRCSSERFNQGLRDIDLYESYCRTHEEFKNSVAVESIAIIKRQYQECCEKHSFLGWDIEGYGVSSSDE